MKIVQIYLHSNMVRFIIATELTGNKVNPHLHSNMVRFIINFIAKTGVGRAKFTFQYG